MKECDVECCDKGILMNNKCVCDIGAFGDDCGENL
jgi:hypothetical protein